MSYNFRVRLGPGLLLDMWIPSHPFCPVSWGAVSSIIMAPLLVCLTLALGWLTYLVIEAVQLSRHQLTVPLRIAVTGTRGKTTVARRLVSVLREDGRRVLGKTTGSEAMYLLPDGGVEEIRRLGPPSIIEQKRLLSRAAKLNAQAIVAEVMSLHPENHRVEVQQILRPHLVLVTNFRVDHSEAQGSTREEVAQVMALDVPPGAKALVPEGEWSPEFQEAVESAGGEVVRVSPGPGQLPGGAPPAEAMGEFGPNADLVWHAARSLGIKDEVISMGISKAKGDVGALRGWRYSHEGSQDSWLLVNAFAANDPESTFQILRRLKTMVQTPAEEMVGILNLRADRGDRTLQWAEALKAGGEMRFRKLFLVGLHASAVRHRLKGQPGVGGIEILRPAGPEGMMDQIFSGTEGGGGLLLGMGNIGGVGRALVEHWEKVGETYGI